MFATKYTVKLVREGSVSYKQSCRTNEEAIQIGKKILGDEPSEIFGIIMLDTQLHVCGYVEITKGILDSSLVHPREVFRAALLHNCRSIIMVHNHPSGKLTPSDGDISVTQRIVDCGKIIGIEVMDHIIVSHEEGYSIRENNHYIKW